MPPGRVRTFKFIGCRVLYREACHLAAACDNRVDVQFLDKGLHDLETPDMAAAVQKAVDAVDARAGYEAVLLGYARCNDGLVGVRARDIPLVLPRAHDCITFFFGSREAFGEYFQVHPGTYFMTSGWSECDGNGADGIDGPPTQGVGVMAALGLDQTHEQFVAKYGADNADFIAETLGSWRRNYSRMLYLRMGVCDERRFIAEARRRAGERGWQFELRDGDWRLLRKLFAGDWDGDFVVIPPGHGIIARNDERVLDASLVE